LKAKPTRLPAPEAQLTRLPAPEAPLMAGRWRAGGGQGLYKIAKRFYNLIFIDMTLAEMVKGAKKAALILARVIPFSYKDDNHQKGDGT